MKPPDLVRAYARRHYIEPARQRGDSTVHIVAGEVEKALHLSNRTPLVCNALRSRKFLEENKLALEREEGPPSGLSTTMKFIYRLAGTPAKSLRQTDQAPFLHLRGAAKDVFESLGGGEAFIRAERAAWGLQE